MQTSVQKQDAVRFGSGVLEIDSGTWWVNIGMVTDCVLEITKLIKQFVWANAKMDPKSTIQEAKFNFNHYELDMSFLNLISWDFDYSTQSATPINITGEALWTWWTVDEPIALANSNGDGTEVSSIVIDENGSPLVLNTDYRVYVKTGITYILPLTAQTGVLDADYTYTPNDSKTAEFGDSDRTLNLNKFRFVNTNEDGKTFTVEFYKAYNSEWLSFSFQWDEDEDPGSYAVSITAFPDSSKEQNVNLFKIVDEQSVA